ncbi:hypothetical protein EGW08_021909, partial [Elysia chlorotica]
MSRRKQSRPRSVKVINDEEEDTDAIFEISKSPSNDDEEDDDSNNNNNNNKNESSSSNNNNDVTISSSNIISSANSQGSKVAGPLHPILSVAPPAVPSSQVNSSSRGEKRNLHGDHDLRLPHHVPGVSGQQVRSSVQHPHRPTQALIPPNFLLAPSSPSSSVTSPLFPSPYLPPPPHLIAHPFTPPHPPPRQPIPSSSSSLSPLLPPTTSPFDEMARRKKSPKSITPWRVRLPDRHQLEDSNSGTTSKPARCQICPVKPSAPLPVEGHEYFIDSDGTLTIKNGVCPRSLALMLFSWVFSNQSHYERLLGENLVKFLLNLKQIVEKHQYMCPTESPLQWTKAQNVLKEYVHSSSLQLLPSDFGSIHSSNPRKRLHPDDNMLRSSSAGQRLSDFYPTEVIDAAVDAKPTAGHIKEMRDRSNERPHIPDNFLVEPLPTPSPSPSHSPPPVHKSSQSARKDKKTPDPGMTLTPTGSDKDPRDGASECGSVGGTSSRVTSPAPSVSSVASSMSLAEAAKQMANTKRGSKILPIASGDGGTRYLCPICALELPNDHELTVHIRSHNTQNVGGQMTAPNSCKICGKTLSSQSSLDRHMLVHSGERPFRCKICDMSFTTNGNMHRHARIHEKNGTGTPKPPGRKPSASSSSQSTTSSSSKTGRSKKESGQSQADGLQRETTPAASSSVHSSLMSEFGGDHKLDLFKSQQDSSAILQYYSKSWQTFGMEVLAKRPRLSTGSPHALMAAAASHAPLAHLAREMAREPSPDLRAQHSIPCNMCPKKFTSQWSLDCHMESHPDSPSPKSTQCQDSSSPSPSTKSSGANSPSSSSKGKDASNSINCSSNNNNTLKFDNNSKQSFQSLDFASFTSKKFPLIAKAFCEEECEGKARAVRLPVFPCSQCQMEFPVEGARDLHEVSHLPEEYTVCPTCKCHFSSSSQLQLHMLKHVSDLHFNESRDADQPDCNAISQAHFLAQFGLAAKDIGALPSSILEGMLEIEQEQGKDIPPTGEDKSEVVPEVKAETVQLIKQENTEDHFESAAAAFDDRAKLEKNTENDEELYQAQPVILPSSSHRDKSLEKGKTSSSTSLKISSSLFGGRTAVKPATSRSPSPLSLSGSDLGHDSQEDSSMPPLFPCKHCGMVLSSPRALKYHQRSHHEAAQFRCQVCSYTSTDKSTLLRHMRTHSGERPYKCAVCEYSFTTKANCERHLSLPTSPSADEDKSLAHPYGSATSSPSPSTASNTCCPACHVDFFNFRGLEQHLQVSPSCRMGYLCLKCKVSFTSRKALISHMSNQHPSVAAQDYNRFTASLEKAGDGAMANDMQSANVSDSDHAVMTPPPAHSHTKLKRSIVSLSTPSLPQSHQKQLLQNLPANLLALLPPGLIESATLGNQLDSVGASLGSAFSIPSEDKAGLTLAVQENPDDQPLDFSSTGRSKPDSDLSGLAQTGRQNNKKSQSSCPSADNYEDDDEVVMPPEDVDAPIDLSMSKASRQQSMQQLPSPAMKALALAQAQIIPPNK